MENNRIQKLLLSEYCDFSDTILVESPFAQTTRDGHGLREVALGLTPSKLVVASDVLNKNSEFICPPDIDPSIESFELVSVYPLEYLALSIFRRRRRRTLKARLIDGRANYYELGGMERRGMFWTLWCKHIQNAIARKGNGSSMSETTAASSSSLSTVCLLSSEVEVDERMRTYGNRSTCRVWARYGGAGDGLVPSWPQKDLFLGQSHAQLGHGYYTPVPVRFAGASLEDLRYELADHSPEKRTMKRGCYSWPTSKNLRTERESHQSDGLCDVLFTRDKNLGRNTDFAQKIRVDGLWSTEFAGDSGDPEICARDTRNDEKYSSVDRVNPTKRMGTAQKIINLAPKISRFAFGIRENCRSGLYLEPYGSRKVDASRLPQTPQDYDKLVESGVVVWETGEKREEFGPGRSRSRSRRSHERHPRRYGIATAAHFLHALGPWSVQPGERGSVQGRRSSSAVGVRRQAPDPDLRLPVSRRQLAASVSATALEPGRCGAMGAATRGRVVLFWTPEYWYRPRAATAAYKELRQHLALLRDFRTDKERCGVNRKKFFNRRKNAAGDAVGEERFSRKLGGIFSSLGVAQTRKHKKNRDNSQEGSGTTSQLRRLLKMDFRVSAWDLDSTTIAHQLTLVDRDLFLRVSPLEMEIVAFQRSSRNAPNLGAWVAFSHRISCLIVSEILAVKKIESRARLIARFINAAVKCHSIGNFHSARSILAGLQSPPIYRLKATWTYLRIHHANKYQAMERLCKTYKSPRTKRYRRLWARAELNPPAMPYVDDLLVRLLGIQGEHRRVPVTPDIAISATKSRRPSGQPSPTNFCMEIESKAHDSLARRILSAAILKLKNGKTRSPNSSTSDNVNGDWDWDTRQRTVARAAYERWRGYVMEVRIVAESNAKLRDMDDRKRRVVEVASWLAECQRSAQKYAYPGHSFAWEFLLKARYKEDRENFFISSKLEPPASI